MEKMLKLLLFAGLLGSALAEGITQQDEIYIVAGILGGVCLLLTIACIYNTITIIGLQSEVRVLQAAGSAVTKAIAESPPPRVEPPRSREPPRENPYGRDDFNRHTRQEDPYRRPPSRENYRMERYTDRSNLYDAYHSNRKINGGPAAPSRPHRDDQRSSGYY